MFFSELHTENKASSAQAPHYCCIAVRACGKEQAGKSSPTSSSEPCATAVVPTRPPDTICCVYYLGDWGCGALGCPFQPGFQDGKKKTRLAKPQPSYMLHACYGRCLAVLHPFPLLHDLLTCVEPACLGTEGTRKAATEPAMARLLTTIPFIASEGFLEFRAAYSPLAKLNNPPLSALVMGHCATPTVDSRRPLSKGKSRGCKAAAQSKEKRKWVEQVAHFGGTATCRYPLIRCSTVFTSSRSPCGHKPSCATLGESIATG